MSSYTKLNVQTVSDMLTQNSNAQRTAWAMRALMLGRAKNPLHDNMIGSPGSGKAVIEMSDMNVTGGKTLVIPTLARLGGRGVQANGERTGAEEKMRQGSFSTSTGRQWFGTALDSVAKNETVIGTQWDLVRNQMLGDRMNKKKSDDLQMEMIIAATEVNTLRPNNKGSREALRSADYFLTDTVNEGQEKLSLLAAKGMNVRTSGAGAMYRCFVFFGSQVFMGGMKKSSKYLDMIQLAGVRGEANPSFTGDYATVNGNIIYSWEVEDHDAYGPIGAPILPRATLGVAIAAGTAAFDIKGGGSAEGAALTDPQYFEFFGNGPYVGCEGTKRAASTGTTRYWLIKNVSGADVGKFGFYSGTVNDGNTLTVSGRLGSAISGIRNTTIGNVVWDTGIWNGLHTDAHPVGSLVMEANSYGQPFCYGLGLGEGAVVCGHANIDGVLGIGNRTEEHRNHDMDHAIGLETAWGCKATSRTDGQPNNYVLVEAAYNPPGLPTIV